MVIVDNNDIYNFSSFFFSLNNKTNQDNKVIECHSQKRTIISYFTFVSLPREPECVWLSLCCFFLFLSFDPNICSFFGWYFQALAKIHFKNRQTYFKNLAVFLKVCLAIFQHNAWKGLGSLHWMWNWCCQCDFTWDLNRTWWSHLMRRGYLSKNISPRVRLNFFAIVVYSFQPLITFVKHFIMFYMDLSSPTLLSFLLCNPKW